MVKQKKYLKLYTFFKKQLDSGHQSSLASLRHTATFAKNIQTIYRKETDRRNIRHPIIIQTRYGRNIRAPEKLEL